MDKEAISFASKNSTADRPKLRTASHICLPDSRSYVFRYPNRECYLCALDASNLTCPEMNPFHSPSYSRFFFFSSLIFSLPSLSSFNAAIIPVMVSHSLPILQPIVTFQVEVFCLFCILPSLFLRLQVLIDLHTVLSTTAVSLYSWCCSAGDSGFPFQRQSKGHLLKLFKTAPCPPHIQVALSLVSIPFFPMHYLYDPLCIIKLRCLLFTCASWNLAEGLGVRCSD